MLYYKTKNIVIHIGTLNTRHLLPKPFFFFLKLNLNGIIIFEVVEEAKRSVKKLIHNHILIAVLKR
jgi:hypothetical protein